MLMPFFFWWCMELAFVALAALLAGFIDAIVGGGGLVSLPALFTAYPQAPAATVLGTNKGMAVWGTAWAAGQFARRVRLPWRRLGMAMVVALAASGLGAWAVTHVSSALLRQALIFGKTEQDMRGLAPVGNEDGARLRSFFGATDILVQLAAR